MHTKFYSEYLKGRLHLDDLGIDCMIILKRMLKLIKCEVVVWIKVAQDRDHGVATCEHGNGPSGSVKNREFHDKLRNYQLLKKDAAPWTIHYRQNDV
jgi:hypothetical protein